MARRVANAAISSILVSDTVRVTRQPKTASTRFTSIRRTMNVHGILVQRACTLGGRSCLSLCFGGFHGKRKPHISILESSPVLM